MPRQIVQGSCCLQSVDSFANSSWHQVVNLHIKVHKSHRGVDTSRIALLTLDNIPCYITAPWHVKTQNVV